MESALSLEAGGVRPPRRVKGRAGARDPRPARTLPVPYKAGQQERGNQFSIADTPGDVPLAERGPLSDPRTAITSSKPWWKIAFDMRSWHESRYGRLPDRGGLGPSLGIRRVLPDGKPGGVSRPLLPFMDGAQNVEPGVMSPVARKSFFASLRRAVNVQRAQNKRAVVEVVPGVPALAFAVAPRFKPGTPSGVRGQTHQTNDVPGTYGAEYGTAGVPADIRGNLAAARMARKETFGPMMRRLYDPTVLTLAEAVQRTPRFLELMREGKTAEAQALFPAEGRIGYRFGVNPNNTGSERLGNIKGTGTDIVERSAIQNPANAGEAQSIANQIAMGKIPLGDAVRLTPSLMKFLPSGERTSWLNANGGKPWGSGGSVPNLTTADALTQLGYPSGGFGASGAGGAGGGGGSGGGGASGAGGGGSLSLGNVAPLAIVAAIAFMALRKG